VQLGITVFLAALAVAIIAMTILVWRAGKQVIDGAKSQKEKEQAYKLVAATLLKVLRATGRNAIFTQEPDIFPEQDNTHCPPGSEGS
jgi:TATA-box binding protein (TBP) (component of TFIID and TFIIIB)